MFHFLCDNVVKGRTISPCFVNYSCLFRLICTDSCTANHHNSFTANYLMNSCGLSQEKALSVSKKVHLKTTSKPDTVLAYLKQNGFTTIHISKLVETVPTLLLSKKDKTLKPKFEFYNSLGLSGPKLAKVICQNPMVLRSSLHKKIIPLVDFLKSTVHTNQNVIHVLQRGSWIFAKNYKLVMERNIAILQAHGVRKSNIVKLLASQPRTLLRDTDSIKGIVEEVFRMGFDPLKYSFCEALWVLASTSKSTREAKFDVFRRWGWPEGEPQSAFQRKPSLMMTSEKKIMLVMDYLVNKLGYDPLLIARHSVIFTYSMEKRIVPRCSLIQVLASKGLVDKDRSLYSLLTLPEKDFLRKCVTKFEKQVPGLRNVYQGKES